jgi:hypothetical protein
MPVVAVQMQNKGFARICADLTETAAFVACGCADAKPAGALAMNSCGKLGVPASFAGDGTGAGTSSRRPGWVAAHAPTGNVGVSRGEAEGFSGVAVRLTGPLREPITLIEEV